MNFAREYHNLIEDHHFIYNRETAVVREAGETPNDRNDRGIILVAFYKAPFSDSALKPSELELPGTTRTYP